jgi:hypothetical protein
VTVTELVEKLQAFRDDGKGDLPVNIYSCDGTSYDVGRVEDLSDDLYPCIFLDV